MSVPVQCQDSSNSPECRHCRHRKPHERDFFCIMSCGSSISPDSICEPDGVVVVAEEISLEDQP